MVKKVKMYAKKVATRYDPPQQSSVGGHHPPTALSKVGKYAFMNVDGYTNWALSYAGIFQPVF